MAQIAIKLYDSSSDLILTDPDKYARYATRQGDIIKVFPDDHIFGRNESKQVWIAEGRSAKTWPGKMVIVKIPGMSVEEAEGWGDAIYDTFEKEDELPLDEFNLDNTIGGRFELPAVVLSQFTAEGKEWVRVRGQAKRKLRQRRCGLTIPPQIFNELERVGEITFDLATVQQYLEDKLGL